MSISRILNALDALIEQNELDHLEKSFFEKLAIKNKKGLNEAILFWNNNPMLLKRAHGDDVIVGTESIATPNEIVLTYFEKILEAESGKLIANFWEGNPKIYHILYALPRGNDLFDKQTQAYYLRKVANHATNKEFLGFFAQFIKLYKDVDLIKELQTHLLQRLSIATAKKLLQDLKLQLDIVDQRLIELKSAATLPPAKKQKTLQWGQSQRAQYGLFIAPHSIDLSEENKKASTMDDFLESIFNTEADSSPSSTL